MEKTWRWFGRKDPITLDMLRQIGVEGIVTSLYDAPNGNAWSFEAIKELNDYIASSGLRWSVVESLPESESVKYGGNVHEELIENYQASPHSFCSSAKYRSVAKRRFFRSISLAE